MNAVGRLGSYLSRGMYTVSAPFHPFGGAVDIVVVEQPDGTFRSSPWYVRFGKFQGVLKSKEKIVKIMVNGVEAELFMYLNNCGQSYFSKEADDDEYAKYGDEVVIRPSSFFEQMKIHHDRRRAMKSRSCDFSNSPATFGRFNSLDSAEIAAQLLEVQWSTSLTTKVSKDKSEIAHFSAPCSPRGSNADRDMLVIDEIVDENYYKGSESFAKDRLSLSSRCSDSADIASGLLDGSDDDGGQVPRQARKILKPINGERKQNGDSGKVKFMVEPLPPKIDNLSQSVDSNPKPLNLPLPKNGTKTSTNSCAAMGSQIQRNHSYCEGNVNSSEELEAHLLNQETKKMLKVLTPSSEQVASLDLKEGSNTVTFTFSTSMLGDQQVDARIYLWKWDNKIVVSDVDGTITKSDVLGQCMPLVGIDWSQEGVARLFSAIRENGYRLLFLSARSISQASVTRQFLLNLKQDGLPLPDGPVVISPDGLFPSLYREVIKRVPHEFKIACLEDIKALFPSECNPFYAGFGNRDTDAISYLKVGIPKGKIFIINPKGEVVVHRHVHPKSYTLMHTLANDMFPPITSSEHEQEDFNAWNFWKLPPPTM